MWRVDSPKAAPRAYRLPDRVTAFALHPSVDELAAGSIEGDVLLWSSASSGGTRDTPRSRGSRSVRRVRSCPKPRRYGRGGHSIRLWTLGAEADPEPLVLSGHSDDVVGLTFSLDGLYLASMSGDETVRVWTMDLDRMLERARDIAGRELTSAERERYLRAVAAPVVSHH